MDEIVGHALGALVVHTGRLVVWMALVVLLIVLLV